jgi:hypothetical protein
VSRQLPPVLLEPAVEVARGRRGSQRRIRHRGLSYVVGATDEFHALGRSN